jgi:hypothetical protein
MGYRHDVRGPEGLPPAIELMVTVTRLDSPPSLLPWIDNRLKFWTDVARGTSRTARMRPWAWRRQSAQPWSDGVGSVSGSRDTAAAGA